MKGTATSKVRVQVKVCSQSRCSILFQSHFFYIPDLSKDPTTLKLLDLNIPKLVYNMYKPFGIKLLNDEDGIKMATITADNSQTAE